MAGNRGGARPGAGRPRTATKYIQKSEAVVERIIPHLDDLIDVQLREARGGYEVVEEEYVRVQGEDGGPATMVLNKRRVSWAKPNLGAVESLLNRSVGRPSMQLDISSLGVEAEGIQITPELQSKLLSVLSKHAQVKLAAPPVEGEGS